MNDVSNILFAIVIAIAAFFGGAYWQAYNQKAEACAKVIAFAEAMGAKANPEAPIMIACKGYY